ncbi:MAG: NAD(P)/FAD-dependent oxidoreductase [Candidatus Thermoplasmatota archaeon]|nr:NAD(P)/FAD-dependent oxidoreductase [Candidatus Thermoplasmatota archaeon]
MRDVIVVGAGPSGSYMGYSLSKMGHDVLILEEHREVGKPVECTGLVSERVMKLVNTKAETNYVTGASIIFPGRSSIHIEKTEKTIVMDRDHFDKDVAGMAIGAGSDFSINSRVISVKEHEDHVSVKYRKDGRIVEENASVVVGADGINSVVRKELYGTRPSRIVSAYQVDSAYSMEDQRSVEVYLGSGTSGGFFGWATPSGDLTKIGTGSLFPTARKFFERLNRNFGSNRILGINGGAIPISYLKRTYSNRSILVGDAAGIVKPLSGGGIYTGIVSSKCGAGVISRAIENGSVNSKSLSLYQKSWRSELGKELWFDGIIQKLFSSLSDRTFDRLYRVISRPEITELINRKGDIDYPSKVVLSVILRSPEILAYLLAGK